MNSTDEPEVDERVHDARRRGRAAASASTRRRGSRARRRLTFFVVVRRSSGCAPLVVPDPQRRRATRRRTASTATVDVEGAVERVGDVDERPRARSASRRATRVIAGQMPEASVHERDEHADDEDELMRLGRSAHRRGTYIARFGATTGARTCDRYVCSVGLAEAVGHAGEQLAREAGHLVDEAGELALAEHDELHVGVGDDGRVAGRLVEQGELAEASPGPSVATLRPWRLDPGRAVEDHEELVAGLALGHERPCRPATRTSSARLATSWSSFLEQAAKSGTCWRWSMNASRRAMGGNLTGRALCTRATGPARESPGSRGS